MRQTRSKPWLLGLMLFLAPAFSNAEGTRFLHDSQEHRTVACESCHTVTVETPDVVSFPPHKPCVQCHNFAEKAMVSGAAYCRVCHEPGPLSATQPAMDSFSTRKKASSDFHLSFLHASHLQPKQGPAEQGTEQPATCADCHETSGVVLDPLPTNLEPSASATDLPVKDPHAGCFTCHGTEPVAEPAMHTCSGCHGTPSPSAREATLQVASISIPGFRHSDHLHDIRPKKKADLIAGKHSDLCRECHAPLLVAPSDGEQDAPPHILEATTCESCHRGALGLPEPLDTRILEALHGR